MKRRALNVDNFSILGKRSRCDEFSISPKRADVYPKIVHQLNPRLQAMVESRQFLENFVRHTPLQTIFRVVALHRTGFYGALNQNNYFWYLVTMKKLAEGYDPVVNFRDVAMGGKRNF